MAETIEVVFVAGRLGQDDGNMPINLLMDRLQERGLLTRVICASRSDSTAHDSRVLESPALAHRWLKPLAIRRVPAPSNLEHPCILHLLHDGMADAGRALAESWGLPYVQTVDDFGVLDRGLKVSRGWFRALVATRPELASELSQGLGVPPDQVLHIAPGIAPAPAIPRSTERMIPVIGTAGLPSEDSGFTDFLQAARLILRSGRDTEFLIASMGNDALDLRRLAQSLRIADRVSVAYYAAIGPRFWAVVDIFCQPPVVPSTGRNLVRALCEGVPSIATHVKGLRGLIDHGSTGMLVPAGNPESLAYAIVEFLDHPDRAALIGDRARDTARVRFDANVEADMLAALYRLHAALPQKQPVH